MIEKSSLKLFLTNGVTITVKEDEKIMDMGEEELDLYRLSTLIDEALEDKKTVEFVAEINHKYNDEDGEQEQKIKHYYNIPYERVSWYIIEEVE